MARENAHELLILEQIHQNPDSTQADLARQASVAVGTVNWYLKRLMAKGFVKATRLQRRRLRYLVTPSGMSEKARLAYQYVQVSMYLYRTTRKRIIDLLQELQRAGYDWVYLDTDGDLADVCRLTCLEQGIAVRPPSGCACFPRFQIDGTIVSLQLPELDGKSDGA